MTAGLYVNLPHYFIPKLCGILSLVFNPVFIYLLITDKRLKLGNYKNLLISFSFFNMICSLYDALVPMCVHDYRYAFVVFISDGPFFRYSPFGQLLLSLRCGLITVTYAILHAHFIYRYLALYKNYIIEEYFIPYGITLTMLYCFIHMISWTLVCEFFFQADDERKLYVQKSFKNLYLADSFQTNMVIALYSEGSTDAVQKSWIGVTLVTISSVFSMVLYFVLGHKIMKKLREHNWAVSDRVLNMQKQLFKALTVQTVIPICVSLLPCCAVWYGPMFLIDIRWAYLTAAIAVSIFPCLDPVAITFFLPSLRDRFRIKIQPITISFPSSVGDIGRKNVAKYQGDTCHNL